MASKMRVEWVRLRDRNAPGIQNAFAYGDQAPVTKAVSGTALTGAGRVTVPATCNGYSKFHARITSDVDVVVTKAPAADAGTTYDATLTEEGGTVILANKEFFLPVSAGELLSAITAPFA